MFGMAISSADLSRVFSLLQDALSQHQAVRKPAEEMLAASESIPGFCSCLLEVIAAKDVVDTLDIRWLASVYFKNSINRYWRQRRDGLGIGDGEKVNVRRLLLELVREENNKVALQLAILVSKIARFDYPRDWPELFSRLVQKLQSPDVLLTQRVYMVLNQILKELSTKRLAADQRNFAEITSQLYDYVWHHWCTYTQSLLQELPALLLTPKGGLASSEVQETWLLVWERWLLCSKALLRMLIFGFQSDARSLHEVEHVKQVCPSFLEAIQSFLRYRVLLEQVQIPQDFLEKACMKLMKALVKLQNTHPYSFGSKTVLPLVLEFCCVCILEQKQERISSEHLLIECMILIQNIVECGEYKPNNLGQFHGQLTPELEEKKLYLARRTQEVVSSILDNKRLLLCEILIQRYFVLTGKDLAEWAQNPETFHLEQDMAQWREKLCPCAESLYLALFKNQSEVLAPFVLQILERASENCPPTEPNEEVQVTEAFLLKEAAYNAVGVANHDLYDYIDFQGWYENALSRDIQNQHPNNRILRRRIAWLLGQWISKFRDDMHFPVYESLIGLLGDADLAVKLAASRSLHNLIDDVHFREEEFAPFFPTTFQLLFQLIQQADEFDSKLQVFNTVFLIIDRLGEKVTSCTDIILSFLPQVWRDSEKQSLLQVQVLLALQSVVIALGPRSPFCYELLFPVLQYSTDIYQPDELTVLEDGLQLWLSTLKHAPTAVTQLLDLFPHLVSMIERSLEHLEVAMRIIESYILFKDKNFLQFHGAGVVKIFDVVVGNVKEKGMLCTLPIIEIFIQCFPGEASPLLEPVLQKLLVLVINGQDEADRVKAFSGAVLARVFVQHSSFFAHLLSRPSLFHMLKELGIAVDQSILLLLYDSWLEKVDSLTSTSRRKVCALAFCILLTSTELQILEKLQQILSTCTSILFEADDTTGQLHRIGDEKSTEPVESQELRRQQALMADPVNQVAFAPLLKEKLQACAALHGEAAFNAAVSRLHPSLVSQLLQLLPR